MFLYFKTKQRYQYREVNSPIKEVYYLLEHNFTGDVVLRFECDPFFVRFKNTFVIVSARLSETKCLLD